MNGVRPTISVGGPLAASSAAFGPAMPVGTTVSRAAATVGVRRVEAVERVVQQLEPGAVAPEDAERGLEVADGAELQHHREEVRQLAVVDA